MLAPCIQLVGVHTASIVVVFAAVVKAVAGTTDVVAQQLLSRSTALKQWILVFIVTRHTLLLLL